MYDLIWGGSIAIQRKEIKPKKAYSDKKTDIVGQIDLIRVENNLGDNDNSSQSRSVFPCVSNIFIFYSIGRRKHD